MSDIELRVAIPTRRWNEQGGFYDVQWNYRSLKEEDLDEMVERAARALYGLMQRDKPWEDDPPGKLDHYRKLARAALDAALFGEKE
jgi:hypothetical protein